MFESQNTRTLIWMVLAHVECRLIAVAYIPNSNLKVKNGKRNNVMMRASLNYSHIRAHANRRSDKRQPKESQRSSSDAN